MYYIWIINFEQSEKVSILDHTHAWADNKVLLTEFTVCGFLFRGYVCHHPARERMNESEWGWVRKTKWEKQSKNCRQFI